jgi:hypothetical protein
VISASADAIGPSAAPSSSACAASAVDRGVAPVHRRLERVGLAREAASRKPLVQRLEPGLDPLEPVGEAGQQILGHEAAHLDLGPLGLGPVAPQFVGLDRLVLAPDPGEAVDCRRIALVQGILDPPRGAGLGQLALGDPPVRARRLGGFPGAAPLGRGAGSGRLGVEADERLTGRGDHADVERLGAGDADPGGIAPHQLAQGRAPGREGGTGGLAHGHQTGAERRLVGEQAVEFRLQLLRQLAQVGDPLRRQRRDLGGEAGRVALLDPLALGLEGSPPPVEPVELGPERVDVVEAPGDARPDRSGGPGGLAQHGRLAAQAPRLRHRGLVDAPAVHGRAAMAAGHQQIDAAGHRIRHAGGGPPARRHRAGEAGELGVILGEIVAAEAHPQERLGVRVAGLDHRERPVIVAAGALPGGVRSLDENAAVEPVAAGLQHAERLVQPVGRHHQRLPGAPEQAFEGRPPGRIDDLGQFADRHGVDTAPLQLAAERHRVGGQARRRAGAGAGRGALSLALLGAGLQGRILGGPLQDLVKLGQPRQPVDQFGERPLGPQDFLRR